MNHNLLGTNNMIKTTSFYICITIIIEVILYALIKLNAMLKLQHDVINTCLFCKIFESSFIYHKCCFKAQCKVCLVRLILMLLSGQNVQIFPDKEIKY